jgi:glycerol-3-phosphate acyltransferase PlsY
MTEILIKILAAYLLGGLMGGDVMRRIKGGADLRQTGSGNVGATNALRTRGAGFAAGVLLIDVGKGVLAALAIPALPWPGSDAPQAELSQLCGAAVALGHCYPLFQRFQGGKGVATLAGVFGALLPWALPWMVLVFAVALVLSGYVALASIGAVLTALLWVAWCGGGVESSAGIFTLAMGALVVFKHRQNIARLLNGSEHRFEKVMLVRKWRGR